MGTTRTKKKPAARTKTSARPAGGQDRRVAEISIAAGDPLQPAGLTEYLKVLEAAKAERRPALIASAKRAAAEKSRATKSRQKK